MTSCEKELKLITGQDLSLSEPYTSDKSLKNSLNYLLSNCKTLLKKNNYNYLQKFCLNEKGNIFKSNEEANKVLEKYFILDDQNFSDSIGLMTGYYEPEINGYSYQKKGSYPIYKNPTTISKKYLLNKSRSEINKGALRNMNLEIAWLENEVETFFLQIQGSGRIKLEDGNTIKVKYDGSNNKKYTSIGKVLIDKGELKKNKVNMFTIKSWLYKNKKRAKKIMERNQRYIFFKKYEGDIKGAANTKLIPNFSVAVDPKHTNNGALMIVSFVNNPQKKFLVMAHDNGAAIKGKNRIDLFTGYGKKAESKAAKLKEKILLKRLFPK